MTRNEALNILISKNKIFKKVFFSLSKWNKCLTVKENSSRINMSIGNSRMFARRYGLRFSRLVIRNPKTYIQTRYDLSKWNSYLSLKENANLLGMSKNYANHFSRKHNLNYYKSNKGRKLNVVKMNEQINKIKYLRKKKFSDTQISRIFNVSRQRISQLC